MVLNNLYVSECTAPSVHIGRVRRQLGQCSRITWFYPSLKAAGQLTFSCTLYSPQTNRVGFLKRSKASRAIKATQRASFRSLCCSLVTMSQSGSSLCYFRSLTLLICLQNEATLVLFFFFAFFNEAELKTRITL